MNVAEELREQARRVEKGWVRGCPEGPNRACAEFWTDDEGQLHYISGYAVAVLASHIRKGLPNATNWNDRKPSEGGPVNRRQVAAVLRRAADAWEREQAS